MWCSASRGAAQEARRIANAAMRKCRATMSILQFPVLPTVKSEEFLCSCCRRASDFFQRNSAGAGDLFCNEPGISRLATFSTERDRREIRAISFDHETVERHIRRDVADLFSVFKSHDSGKRNEMAETENFVRLLERAAEAMKHAADLAPVFAQDCERVIPSVALMND